MDITAPQATIPASTLSASSRTMEALIETSIPGIYLSVATSHTNRTYWSRIDRVQIEGGILTMKIDAARFRDTPPVAQRRISAARYSAKNLATAHELFISGIGTESLTEALLWAERF